MISQDFVRQSTGLSTPASRQKNFWRLIHTDPPLLVGICLLSAFGLFILYSASDANVAMVQRQGLSMVLGLVLMFVIAQFNVHFFRSWAPSFYAAGLALLGVVLWIGVEENGARSWIDLPGLPSFQPSELMKFGIPLMLAWYLASRPLPPRFKHVFWSFWMIMAPAGLIVLQNDMGTALMVVMSGAFVLLLAGLRWRVVVAGLVSLALVSPAWYLFLAQEHQRNRILTFFD
ncbi:MAG: FtsW/RodA/SpoVE family cell cycle protein, partial [Gammaproteobacteria bacterium]